MTKAFSLSTIPFEYFINNYLSNFNSNKVIFLYFLNNNSILFRKYYLKDIEIEAQHGHLDVVKWLSKNRSKKWTTSAMDSAAENGHLDVVKWLHANRTEGCTNAMDDAAKNSHLDVVKFLHINLKERGTIRAMNDAALFDYLTVLLAYHRQ